MYFATCATLPHILLLQRKRNEDLSPIYLKHNYEKKGVRDPMICVANYTISTFKTFKIFIVYVQMKLVVYIYFSFLCSREIHSHINIMSGVLPSWRPDRKWPGMYGRGDLTHPPSPSDNPTSGQWQRRLTWYAAFSYTNMYLSWYQLIDHIICYFKHFRPSLEHGLLIILRVEDCEWQGNVCFDWRFVTMASHTLRVSTFWFDYRLC